MDTRTLEKVDDATTKMERKAKSVKRSVKKHSRSGIYAALILIGFVMSYTTFKGFIAINNWSVTHKIVPQSVIVLNIKFQAPIRIESPKAMIITPTSVPRPTNSVTLKNEPPMKPLSDKEIVMTQKHGDVLWKIYALETSRGKNDICRNNGQGYGGYGVMSSGVVVCYPTFIQATERAEYWLSKNGVDTDLAMALCLWNVGIATRNCDYYKNYLTLN